MKPGGHHFGVELLREESRGRLQDRHILARPAVLGLRLPGLLILGRGESFAFPGVDPSFAHPGPQGLFPVPQAYPDGRADLASGPVMTVSWLFPMSLASRVSGTAKSKIPSLPRWPRRYLRREATAGPGVSRSGYRPRPWCPQDRVAADHRDSCPGDVAGLVGGQWHVDWREFGGPYSPVQQKLGTDALDPLGGHGRRSQRNPDRARGW